MTYSFLRPDLQPDTRTALPYIPRMIWQVTSPQRLADPRIAEAIDKLRKQNPEWSHNCLLDSEIEPYVQQVGSDRLLRALRRLSPDYPQARSDIYRYLRLFLSGGVYFDDKSGASRPLDAIIHPDDRFLIAQHTVRKRESFAEKLRSQIGGVEGGEFLNWFIASAPGHPFLARVLETLIQKIEGYSPLFSSTGKRAVLELTGPLMYTKAIAPIRAQHPHRMLKDATEGLLYSRLPDTTSHEMMPTRHYSTLYTPPVTPDGLGPVRRLRFEVEKLLVAPIATVRRLNGQRLRRRWARKRSG